MNKTVTGILIDPFNLEKIVSLVDLSSYKDIYSHLNTSQGEVKTFDAARINAEGDVVYVDDEGLLRGPTNFIKIKGYPSPSQAAASF